MPEPVTDISPVASSLAALVAAHRSNGEGRAPLAGEGQLPRGRPRPLLPRAGCVHPGGQGGVPGLRGPGRLPRVRARPRREVRHLGRALRAGAPPGPPPARARAPRRASGRLSRSRARQLARAGEARLDRLIGADARPLEERRRRSGRARRRAAARRARRARRRRRRRVRASRTVSHARLEPGRVERRRGSSTPATGRRDVERGARARARPAARRRARAPRARCRARAPTSSRVELAVHRDQHGPRADRDRAEPGCGSRRTEVGSARRERVAAERRAACAACGSASS